jgi:hypothetical protein
MNRIELVLKQNNKTICEVVCKLYVRDGRLKLEKGIMSRGKYLSLEEARKDNVLAHFAKEHLSEGDQKVF